MPYLTAPFQMMNFLPLKEDEDDLELLEALRLSMEPNSELSTEDSNKYQAED